MNSLTVEIGIYTSSYLAEIEYYFVTFHVMSFLYSHKRTGDWSPKTPANLQQRFY